jgi:hypothetical protein
VNRPGSARAAAAALAAVAAAVAPRPARAVPPDGAYGRLGGDLAFALEAGAAASERVAPAGRLQTLYLATAGLYLTAAGRTSDAAPWSFGAGVELRPLFLPRFFRAYERGPAALDLTLDSISLRLGARRDERGEPPALELGTGIELPLAGRFDGPFLGLGVAALLPHAALAAEAGPDAAQFLGTLTIGWRALAGAHVVDARDDTLR